MTQDSETANDFANALIKGMEDCSIAPKDAYTYCGLAFYKLHRGLGFNHEDWLQTTQEMATLAFNRKSK